MMQGLKSRLPQHTKHYTGEIAVQLLSKNSFKLYWKEIIVYLFVIMYVAINVFRIGGETFLFNLNNSISIPLALGATIMAMTIWRGFIVGSLNRFIWSNLTIGLTLWTIAELWWTGGAILGQEIPYPSWADFFWIVGYVPMYFALWTRIRSIHIDMRPSQVVGLWATNVVSLGSTIIFVLFPIVQNNEPSAFVESALNILYPIVDLILLILVLRMLFTFQQGMYGKVWAWLSVGFMLRAFGDLVFAYANTVNLYYPDQQINLLSTMGVDVPYSLSYLVIIIGLFALSNVLNTYLPVANDIQKLRLVPNTHLLVFTRADEMVIDTSRNHSQVYTEDTVKGKTIAEVLGLSAEDELLILNDLKARSIFNERQFMANTRFGQKEVMISGVVVLNPQNQYSGVMLLVRLLIEEDYSLDHLLTDYEKAMVRALLSKTGTEKNEQTEIRQLLADYYRAHLRAFYDRVFSEGGSIFAETFMTNLRATVKRQGWPVELQPNSLDASNISVAEARKALPILLETARQFVSNFTDETSARSIIQQTRSNIGDSALRNISYIETAENA